MLRFDHGSPTGWRLAAALDRLDPGTHRRIKGLRLVTAFGLAAMLATVPGIAHGRSMLLGTLAAGFALWASVSEARSTRYESARDLTLLCLAAGIGAASFAILFRWLSCGWAELTLVFGCFCVGYLKRFGGLGGGIGSQLFIGQLLAYGATVVIADLGIVALAVALAILASVVPRTLSGPAEQPALAVQSLEIENDTLTPEFVMGLVTRNERNYRPFRFFASLEGQEFTSARTPHRPLPSVFTAITSSRTIENLVYLDRRQADTLYRRKLEWPVRARHPRGPAQIYNK